MNPGYCEDERSTATAHARWLKPVSPRENEPTLVQQWCLDVKKTKHDPPRLPKSPSEAVRGKAKTTPYETKTFADPMLEGFYKNWCQAALEGDVQEDFDALELGDGPATPDAPASSPVAVDPPASTKFMYA